MFLNENPAWKVYLLLDFESIKLMIKYKWLLKKNIVSGKENPARKVYLLLNFVSIKLMIKYKRALKKKIGSKRKSC